MKTANGFKKKIVAHAISVVFGTAAFVSLMPTVSYAQSNTTGTIYGQVPVSTASQYSVILENLGTGTERKITPDASGKYQATSMPPGHYKVRLMNADKEETTLEVEAVIGSGVEASFVENKDKVQTVVITSKPRGVDVSTTNNGAVFTAKQLDNLPMGQSTGSIILLAPGTNASVGNYSAAPSFGGAGASENAYYINGFPVVNGRSGIGFTDLPFGAIQNAQILTGGYGAEFGNSTGGVSNITTKSGTNTWEVGAKYEYTPESLRAKPLDTYYPNTGANPLTDGKLYRYNQSNTSDSHLSAAYLGGPLIKDKLFLFGAVQDTHSSSGYVGSTSANPTSPGGWGQSSSDTLRYLVKLDFNLNDDNHFEYTRIYDGVKANSQSYGYNYATLSRNNVQSSNINYVNCCENNGQGADPGAADNIFKYTGYVTSDLTITALYGTSSSSHKQTPNGYDANLFQTSSTPATQVPGLVYNNPQVVGGNLPRPGSEDSDKTFRLDAEYHLNNHSIRGGIDYTKTESVYGFSTAGGGLWQYDKTNSPTSPLPYGGNLTPAQGGGYGTQGYYVESDFSSIGAKPKTTSSAQYIEDRWQVNKQVLLSLGLRNEQFTNRNDLGQVVETQHNELAPRLGASWDVNGDQTLKVFGNAGRYYMPEPNMIVVGQSGSIVATNQYYTYTGVNQTTGAPTGLNPISGVVSVNGYFGQPLNPQESVAQNIKPLYTDEFTLGFEKALAKGINVGLSVNYNKLRSTQAQLCDPAPIDNWAAAHGIDSTYFDNSNVAQNCILINPGQANTLLEDFTGNGKLTKVNLSAADIGYPRAATRVYKALNLFAEHEFRDSWYGRVDYTYSQLKGNTEGEIDTAGGGTVTETAVWNIKQIMDNSYGLLPNDHTHVIKAIGYFQVTHEWTLGSNLNIQTGAPKSCYGNYPNAQPGSYAAGYGSSFFYCNGVAADRGSLGRLPTDVQLNLEVAYQPEILRGLKFKVDVFNVLNRQTELSENETYNSGTLVNPNFGQAGALAGPRFGRLTLEYNHKFD